MPPILASSEIDLFYGLSFFGTGIVLTISYVLFFSLPYYSFGNVASC